MAYNLAHMGNPIYNGNDHSHHKAILSHLDRQYYMGGTGSSSGSSGIRTEFGQFWSPSGTTSGEYFPDARNSSTFDYSPLASSSISTMSQDNGLGGPKTMSGMSNSPSYRCYPATSSSMNSVISHPYSNSMGGYSGSNSSLPVQPRLVPQNYRTYITSLQEPHYQPQLQQQQQQHQHQRQEVQGLQTSSSLSHYNQQPSQIYAPQSHQLQHFHQNQKPLDRILPKGSTALDYTSLVNFTVSPNLKRRRRLKLRGSSPENAYACNKCSKVFLKPYNLKSHMKTHSDERPFKCSVCAKTFARGHDKRRHELLHKGEKNFQCEGYLKDGVTRWGCGKKFARSDALSRHFRTETGWLCIKPLMDEAKDLELQSHPNDVDSADLSPTSDISHKNAYLINKLVHGK
ncbi:uncharacterized protein PRCAT00002256001 [Priceomyces carsonii]|uniref:uncharacterized protein n=1 Tax=Priceomyces carsonii TaxID=28549 RepID=UPI002EDAA88A|nr:unnamed protein product [Priceomyces carsonii]